MADETGHRDRPGIGPLNSAQMSVGGILTNYYWFQNPATDKYELVKVMPSGTPDLVLKEFPTYGDLHTYFTFHWTNHSLP